MSERPTRPSRTAASTRVPPAARHKRFALEYLIDNNASAAARRAGYAVSNARDTGWSLLQRKDVQKWIEEGQAKAAAKLGLTRDDIINQLRNLGFSNPLDFGRVENGQFIIDLDNADRAAFAAVSELTTRERTVGTGEDAKVERETKLKLVDRHGPLVSLGRHLGMWRDDGASELTVSFTIVGLENQEIQIARAKRPRAPVIESEWIDPATVP